MSYENDVIRDSKVVRGSCANGFVDVTGPLTHKEAVDYLREHCDEIADGNDDSAEGLDIMSVTTGRLKSWVLR